MAILVTGGAGFIGSHVCDELLKRGKEVVCLDSLNDYYSPKTKIKNIVHNLGNKNFHFFTTNIRERHKLEPMFKKFNFEGIIHLAARAGVRESINDPISYRETNVTGTTNLLHLAKDFNVKKFVFASSSSVYGDSAQIPFHEEDKKVGRPVSPYAASKLASEIFAFNYSHLFDINVTGLRYFTVYGPRNRPDMAMYKFAKSITDGKPIDLYQNGELQRDFTYVGDIVDGTLRAYDKGNWSYEIINLGNSSPVKTRHVVELLENHLGKKAIITSSPKPKPDLEVTHADVNKAKRLLDWEPKTSLQDGIKNFVEWFKLQE